MNYLKVFSLGVLFLLAACDNRSGDEYVGMWKELNSENKLQIEKDSNSFVATSYTKLYWSLDGNQISKNRMAANLKNDGLEISGTFGNAKFVIDNQTGHLIGAGSEYQKDK
jgi:hypothetical protein